MPWRPALLSGILFVLFALSADGRAEAPLSAAAAYELPQPPPGETIAWGPETRQFGELRIPAGDGPFPVAIIIHGGCWLADYDGSYMASFAEAVTELGLATWSIGYRRVGETGGGWPNTFLDVGEAVDFLPSLAGRYPLDLGRVIAVGHSAGGHLALWLAARESIPDGSPLHDDEPLPVGAVLGIAAAADLDFLARRGDCGDAATRLMGGSPEQWPDRYADGSPLARPVFGIPQILVNGDMDEQWSAPANRYYEAARQAGAQVERRIAPSSGHFEPVIPGSPGWVETQRALVDLLERIESNRRPDRSP